MSTEDKLHNDPERPWDRILLTVEMPDGASTSPISPDDVPTGFYFEKWRSIRNPRELMRLIDQYDMLSDGGAVEFLNGDDDEVWTHFDVGKTGHRAATVRVTAERFDILEGQPFWRASLHETDPLSHDDDVECRIAMSRGYIELVLQGLRDGAASETEFMESAGGAACHA